MGLKIIENTACSNCDKFDVCKYVEERAKTKENLLKIHEERSEQSPIEITLSCSKFYENRWNNPLIK